jgi:hypothetical protein
MNGGLAYPARNVFLRQRNYGFVWELGRGQPRDLHSHGGLLEKSGDWELTSTIGGISLGANIGWGNFHGFCKNRSTRRMVFLGLHFGDEWSALRE